MRRVSVYGLLAVVSVMMADGGGLAAADGQGEVANPCLSPANRIIAENCKPGNPPTEWDINGAGDPTIQGFAADISYNRGDTAQFKIKTDSSQYRLDIYRTGWYQGLGARLITTLQPSATLPQTQPDCVTDWSTRLYDCGNWGVSASWPIPADALSGVYVARLVRADGRSTWRTDNSQVAGGRPEGGAMWGGALRNAIKEPRASHIVFIVRDDASSADIVMQTTDPDWTAYNSYGLGSVYNARTAGGESGGQNARAYKVSRNRPLTTRDANAINQYFHSEFSLVRWLERNGFDVTYISGLDADRYGHLLKRHKLFITTGHDEYWSADQRRNVEAARDAGVNLAFLTGNDVYWKIRYEPSIDGSNTPYRTLVCYKDSHTVLDDMGELQQEYKLDPVREIWTGLWRDASPSNPEGPQPENALTGTIFTVNANAQGPMTVPATFGKLRFWRNTEVARLRDGEHVVYGFGMLGHEWNEDLDNGFRPAGLIRLSETIQDGATYAFDWGSVWNDGTGVHSMTLYRAPSGALVFSGASAQFAWALDNFHDYPTARRGGLSENPFSFRVGASPYGPSRAVQQAMVNLFAEMGIQPRNLQADLVPATRSSDRSGPTSRVLMPADGATVSAEVVTITGTAADVGGVVAGVEVSVDGGKSWRRATGTDKWSYEWRVPDGTGSVTILSRATDDSVNMEKPGRGVKVSYAKRTATR